MRAVSPFLVSSLPTQSPALLWDFDHFSTFSSKMDLFDLKLIWAFPFSFLPLPFWVPNAVLSVDISEPQRCLQTSSALGSRRHHPNLSQYSDYSHLCCLIGSPRENYNPGPSSPCKTQISAGNQKAFCILMKTFGVKCGVFLEHLRAPRSSPPITHQGNGSGSS